MFTGVVTQMQEHHGIVDQEVHFPVRFVCLCYSALISVDVMRSEVQWRVCGLCRSVVVGRVPLVGEKVLVKAVQDPLKPVSWTAQKVQTLNGQVWSIILGSYFNNMSLRHCYIIEMH